jgi:hypothetical protein
MSKLDRMQQAKIVEEIGSLCGELQDRLARIQRLSDGLYQRVRRAPVDDNTAVYLRYASAWTRFASMAAQGVKRASAGNRVLRQLVPVTAATESVVKPAIRKAPVASTPVESLLEMYSDSAHPPATEAE